MSDRKDDIEKYLKGELSPKEMHELEKKALSDPFLADALEGGMSIDHHDFSKDVDEINEKIYKGKRGIFTPLRIAAGVIILISLGVFLFLPSKRNESIALKKIEEDSVKADPITVPQQAVQPTLSTEKPRIRKMTEPKPLTTEDMIEAATVVTSLSEHDTTTVVKVEPAPIVVAKNAHVISGTVTTKEDNLPLSGVTVLIKGTTRGTTTDLNGNYTVEVADTASLLFSFVGMTTNEVVANNKSTVDIKMDEDVSQLSEVVIARTALPSDDDTEGPEVRLAQPVGGIRAYDKYLESSRQYPQQALDNDVKGRVIVGFDVATDGRLMNFKVIRSLGYGCDEEVLRLVKAGAAWNPTTEDNKPVESTVHVKVKFDAVKYKKRKK